MEENIRSLTEQKLKAFSIGLMCKRPYTKKELGEQRKKEEEKQAAHAFEEFVATFHDTSKTSKVWVKAGTYDAGAGKEDTKDKGTIYKPQSRVPIEVPLDDSVAPKLLPSTKPERLGKKKPSTKSNLEAFKEELRQIQEEREERHKFKGAFKVTLDNDMGMLMKGNDVGSFDNGDPATTNLYLGNLSPKITEQHLLEVFGKYGPLASIKIMYPRTDEEKARGRNCGFVAYMSRKDGERAYRALNGKDVFGFDMKMGWGKSIIIPPHPIYIPPCLLRLALPPPPSGLPFNAQTGYLDKNIILETPEELEELFARCVVKVVMPSDRNLLMIIHRMVEFVVREGPMLEAMIMNREMHNPAFRFLFDNKSPAHTYYRWKIFSIMQGETQREWRSEPFRMFKGGSMWKPPVLTSYINGMPDSLIENDSAGFGSRKHEKKGLLSKTQRDRLEDLIRSLTMDRTKIGEAMVFVLDHSDAAEEIVDCITESLSNAHTLITNKIARFYLVLDVLHNCGLKIVNGTAFRHWFQLKLETIITEMKNAYDKIENPDEAEGYKLRVLRVLQTLDDNVYDKEFIQKLRMQFLGLTGEEVDEHENPLPLCSDEDNSLDGTHADTNMSLLRKPLIADVNEDDENSGPADSTSLLKNAMACYENDSKEDTDSSDQDINGKDIADMDDLPDDFVPISKSCDTMSNFVLSKWESVDIDEGNEAQVSTASKWEQSEVLDEHSQESGSSAEKVDASYDNSDSNRSLSEDKRNKLREVEVRAVQYQDELESGIRSLKTGWTLQEQVDHYRKKLLRKVHRSFDKKERKAREGHKRGGGIVNYSSDDNDDSRVESSSSSRKHKSKKSTSPDSYRSPPRKKSSKGSSSPISKVKSYSRSIDSPTSYESRSSKHDKKRSLSPTSSNGNSKSRRSASPNSPRSTGRSPSYRSSKHSKEHSSDHSNKRHKHKSKYS